MTYKETLFFIGKCLTVNYEKHNLSIVTEQLKSNQIDWDKVVKVSTAHYVFPALYCNLKRAELLGYLPADLVEYMMYITELNRGRNLQIIEQAKEINKLLRTNNITPIFLKGTSNLLCGLYEDIAERMVGDIDFIVDTRVYHKTLQILRIDGYSNVRKSTFDFPSFKHYPRLKKKNKIAAVEIHKELLVEKFATEFNYKFIKKDSFTTNKTSFLSYKNQLSLSIIAIQINDSGNYYHSIALRNTYDVFLLSKKADSLEAIASFDLLFNPLNNFLALCNYTLGDCSSIKYKQTKDSIKYVEKSKKLLSNKKLRAKNQKKIRAYLFFKSRLQIILKSIHHKETRNWIIKRIRFGRQH
ncbi:MAG: nucleotidyltransferase family protein [Flavobacteriaceae bacterium]|nr:nucleotidyltransferase family protein [Flavobacteriaceae bacterium]